MTNLFFVFTFLSCLVSLSFLYKTKMNISAKGNNAVDYQEGWLTSCDRRT